VHTLIGDRLAFPLAGRTGRGGLHLAQKGIGNPGHMPAPVTGTAGIKGGAVLGACTVTMMTGDIFLDLDFFLHAGGHLFQGEGDLHTQIGAAVDTAAAPAPASAETAEASEAPEGIAKDIPEHREDVIHRHASAAEPSGTSHTRMPELVIAAPFLRIA